MAVTAVAMTAERVLDAFENLSPESRIALAKFIAFLEQQEAEEDERLIMADPELAESIRDLNERCDRGESDNFTRLEDLPRDV